MIEVKPGGFAEAVSPLIKKKFEEESANFGLNLLKSLKSAGLKSVKFNNGKLSFSSEESENVLRVLSNLGISY